MMHRTAVLLFLFCCLALSCTPPGAYEKFVPAPGTEENIYIFDVDLSDTSCLYDVSFYTKETKGLYRSSVEVAEAGEWRLAIQLTDPPKGLRGLGVIFKRVER